MFRATLLTVLVCLHYCASTGPWHSLRGSDQDLITTRRATVLQIANIDGTGTDDLIVHFAGYGVWSYRNLATWAPLNPGTPTVLRSGGLASLVTLP
jgi:hypothetical protein